MKAGLEVTAAMPVASYLRVVKSSGDKSSNASATNGKTALTTQARVHQFKEAGYYCSSLHEKQYFCATDIVQFFM